MRISGFAMLQSLGDCQVLHSFEMWGLLIRRNFQWEDFFFSALTDDIYLLPELFSGISLQGEAGKCGLAMSVEETENKLLLATADCHEMDLSLSQNG